MDKRFYYPIFFFQWNWLYTQDKPEISLD